MRIYSGKDKQNARQTMTATQETVRSLTRTVEGIGYKLYTDFFSSPDLMTYTQEVTTVRQNHKEMQGWA
jgi:archaellum biogenesis ATPase FlaH